MKLSAKAQRFVAEAARDLSGTGRRDLLLSWLDRSGEQDLPPQIATLALGALERFEFWLRQRLESGAVDEDQRADLMNDIAFVHSIESDLRHAAERSTAG
jgi:hypothetical protein